MYRPIRHLLLGSSLASLLLLLGTSTLRADTIPVPEKLKTPLPDDFEELRVLEQQVQKVVKMVMKATVGIRIGAGQGSGVIVSDDGYILTAGHVSGAPNQMARIILPNGKILRAKTLGRNGGIDSGMLKILDKGPFPHVDLGKSADLKRGEWCIAIGHPGGFRSNRDPVVRLGRLLFVSNSFLRSDCTLVNGDSGGPLFNLRGELIGIHSRISGPITMNIHVPIDTYQQTWERLAKGESFGGRLGSPSIVKSEGGDIVLEENKQLTNKDPMDKQMQDSHHKVFELKLVPGSAYTIDLSSKDFDSYLRLEDGKGKQKAENDDGAGKLNSRIVFRPSREDTYRIIVTSFEPGQTGKFNLTVRKAGIEAKGLPSGKVDVLKALRIPRKIVPALVSKFSKAGIALYASAFVLDDKGRPIPSKKVAFVWNDGKYMDETDEQGRVRLRLSPSKINGLTLDVPDGLHAALQLTDESGNPPPLSFKSPDNVPAAKGKSIFEKKESLSRNDPFDRLKKNSRCQVHAIKMQAGKSYTIDLKSKAFDPFLRLEDAKGKELASDDDSGGDLDSRIIYRPTRDGEYSIIVTTFGNDELGAYSLSVHEAD